MKKEIPAWLVLAIIMLVASFCLAGTNLITKDVISEQAALDEVEARKRVLPVAENFSQVVLAPDASLNNLFIATREGGDVGYVGSITVSGYGGPIDIIAGITLDGVVSGVDIGGSDFAETAGLGAKAREEAFMSQFAGKVAPLKAIKEGETKADNTIDVITAATITTNAVVRGVNDIVKNAQGYSSDAIKLDASEEYPAIEVLFDSSGVLEALLVKTDEKVDYALLESLLGSAPPFEEVEGEENELLSKLRVAVNAAYEKQSSPELAPFAGGTASANPEGFGGPIYVEVTFDENSNIIALKVGDDNFAETPGIGDSVLEEDFIKQFIGKSAPIDIKDIDVASGATVSTQAVIDGINVARASLDVASTVAFAGGTASVSPEGFGGPVFVEVTFDENSNITALKIGDDNFAETPGIGDAVLEDDFIKQFIGKAAPIDIKDIDAASGATVSTQAVIDGINEAFEKLIAPVEEVAEHEEKTVSTSFEGKTASASAEGFGGPIYVEVTFDENSNITALKVGDDNFAETPGIGDAVLEEDFVKQFIGKAAPIDIKDIDAASGATVSTQAVIDGINEAFEKLSAPAEEAVESETETEPESESAEGEKASASAEGFGGPVYVEVTFDENSNITALKIGDDNFAETPGIGDAVLEEDFIKQFIGKSAPIDIKDIDAASGATVSTQAVIDGINEAFEKLSVPAAEVAEPETEPESESAEGETASASAEGFGGPVYVEVTFNENSNITALKIGDDNFAETPGIGDAVLEEDFIKQFIGKSAPIDIKDIDAASGATISTQAVIDGINEAFEKLSVPAAEVAEPETEPESESAEGVTSSASPEGFGGPVYVEVTFDENSNITALKIGDDNFAETPGIGDAVLEEDFIKQFIGKAVPMDIKDIDAASGATVSTQAVIDGINEAFNKLQK
ncbi:MAG TPA: FMN-binding protein [Christensenellaceae bacterium]|nr:FMN-binding protein [Christensenellaceae bacterium]